MSDFGDSKAASRDRSPSFPAIPLSVAVDRLAALEVHFKRSPARASRVGAAWGMKEKSSQADSTLAALRAYGLVEYHGSSDEREAVISEDGRIYLRAQQDGIKRSVLRRAALRPRNIAKFWHVWGADRPADPVCLDELRLKAGFSDSGAQIFLKVYDATIDYARLSDSDNLDEGAEENGFDTGDAGASEGSAPSGPLKLKDSPPPANPKRKGILMEGERELTTGLLSRGASFRLIVSGSVGEKEIERLIKKLELDKEILADAATAETGDDESAH